MIAAGSRSYERSPDELCESEIDDGSTVVEGDGGPGRDPEAGEAMQYRRPESRLSRDPGLANRIENHEVGHRARRA